MARHKFPHVWAAFFLIFLFFQAALVIHYAQKLEKDYESGEKGESSILAGDAASLISPLNAHVSLDILTYRRDIARTNADQFIRNDDILGNFSLENGTVFVIQVHNRVLYLEALIESLQAVRGIEDALLVFSHDFYSKEINHLIGNIKFARVLQIFYPYGSQIYPKGYPGPGRLSPHQSINQPITV